jgi:hypothetical protein
LLGYPGSSPNPLPGKMAAPSRPWARGAKGCFRGPSVRRRAAVWRYAARRLNEAAADKDSLPDAEGPLTRALKTDGLVSIVLAADAIG